MQPMSPPEIDALLAAARLGRLAMADPAGRPYIIPLPFCFHNGALYLRVPPTGRKESILAQNNQVCFEIDTCDDSFDAYASILLEGRLLPVTDLAEKAAVRAATTEKYHRLRAGHRPGHGRSTPLEDTPLRKIAITQISGRKKSAP